MAAAKKRPAAIDHKGEKIQQVRKGVDKVDVNKRYLKLADKRPHSERFDITVDRLKVIAERMKNGK